MRVVYEGLCIMGLLFAVLAMMDGRWDLAPTLWAVAIFNRIQANETARRPHD